MREEAGLLSVSFHVSVGRMAAGKTQAPGPGPVPAVNSNHSTLLRGERQGTATAPGRLLARGALGCYKNPQKPLTREKTVPKSVKKKKHHALTRRSFLKKSIGGSLVGSAAPMIFIPRLAPSFEGFEDPHPHISGLRVVGVHDPAMSTEELPVCPWRKQEQLVEAEAVGENIDRMACVLAEEKRVSDAWKKIFVKPPKKSWKDAVVAIKTNNIFQQQTHSAVMAKFCNVLVGEIGVRASNIFIYDSCHGADMLKKTPFKGLPENVNVAALWEGIEVETAVPAPWKSGDGKSKCVGPLVEGKVDLLINIALCKGHSPAYGQFTMLMKNHLGTFSPRPAHAEGGTDYLFAINKTAEILGDLDGGGKVVFPRQQLCFIDALWASQKGPTGLSSAQPNRFFMGTFAPVVDYTVAHRLRQKKMKWPIAEAVTDRFLTEFGLEKKDLLDGGSVIDALEV